MPVPEKVALFTNEYPPHVYGGAGVHVEYLSRELARLVPVEVRCFGEQDVSEPNLRVKGYPAWPDAKQNTDPRFGGALDAMYRSLAMAKDNLDASIVHCHTWYVQFGGFLAKKLWGIPFVLTTHSLEPLRPWKVEQLGNAYHLSPGSRATASRGRRRDRRVAGDPQRRAAAVPDVDPGQGQGDPQRHRPDEYRPTRRGRAGERGVDPERPYVLFVGRITRQKGIIHLVNAIPHIDPAIQVVLCAGAPDTPEIGREMAPGGEVAERASANRPGVIWIQEMLPHDQVIQLLLQRGRVLLPVGVRAVRHHQPGSDGVRDPGGRVRGRRHPRSGRA